MFARGFRSLRDNPDRPSADPSTPALQPRSDRSDLCGRIVTRFQPPCNLPRHIADRDDPRGEVRRQEQLMFL